MFDCRRQQNKDKLFSLKEDEKKCKNKVQVVYFDISIECRRKQRKKLFFGVCLLMMLRLFDIVWHFHATKKNE